jgi:hypothetical protein
MTDIDGDVDDMSYDSRRYRRDELERRLRSVSFEIPFSSSYTVTLLPLLAVSRLIYLET